ncbi:MAG: hypothetical protein ACOCVW_00690 [bacterium]
MRAVQMTLLAAMAVLLALTTACSQPLNPEPEDGEPSQTSDDPVPEDPPDDPPARQELTIDFDAETNGYVGEAFDGSGIAQEPEPGFLDADGWEIIGFSDGDLAYGEEADGGDYARGTSVGGVSTGGLYAFTVGDGNTALGVQPTGTDFAPGSVGIRIPVGIDAPARVAIAYTLWVRNDEDRSTRWTCEISADGETFAAIDELVLVTGEAATDETWARHDLAATIGLREIDLPQPGTLHVRWVATDESGTGSRDETAIDDIAITFESD